VANEVNQNNNNSGKEDLKE